MPKRILVLSASVGAGHMRAAEAVELALRQLAPEAEIQNIDVLDLTNATFRRLYGKLYVDLVNTAPHLLGSPMTCSTGRRRRNASPTGCGC